MRARMAIAISGQQVEFREVILRDKPQSMIELSPKGTVPVLSLSSGQVIDESLDVIDWALKLNDPDNWLRSNKSEKSSKLIHTNDNEFKHHLDRYKYSKRYDNEDPEFHRKECLKFIESINNELNNSEYIFDDNISYADIVLLPFIRQFRIADIEWFDSLPYDNLKKWLSSFLDSSLLNSIMKKYDLWKEGDKSIVF